MDLHNEADNNSSSPPQGQKRPRAKQACEPCRLRKRRCDGAMPCDMCAQFEYKCYFEKHPRKRSKLVEQNAHLEATDEYVRPQPPQEDKASLEDLGKVKSMEANSGIAFTRLLGQRLDPSSGPKLLTFGWNLGSSVFVPPAVTPITNFLGQGEMFALAKYYFDNIHVLYGFLDQAWVLEQTNLRWTKPELCMVPDHMFAGIAALGSLWSDGSVTIDVPGIVDSAKRALDSNSMMLPPTLEDIQGWLLRALYLRVTDHPHATHMASSVAMHLVEAIGLHQEDNSTMLYPPAGERPDVETRRRTFWCARLINTFVSFEYGRTRVVLRGITAELPTQREGDYTADFVNLYSLSCSLDPERSDAKWEEFLIQLDEFEVRHDGIEMSRTHLGLCGSRRLRLTSPSLSSEAVSRIIKIGLRGLEAAQRQCRKGMPWWHVSNVPFQAVCVFLAMDVKESLQHVATAMRVLEEVADKFRTVNVKEALKCARFLVRLSKARKDEDSDVLGSCLKKDVVLHELQPVDTQVPQLMDGVGNGPTGLTPLTSSSSEDWNFDILNNPEFDWNFFLTADMPAFNSFAPDGTM